MGSGEQTALMPDGEKIWRAALTKLLAANGGRSADATTYDGLAIEPLYLLGREAHPQPLRSPRAIGIIQPLDHPNAEDARALALSDLEGGASGLSLVVAGAGAARGFGLNLADEADVERLLDGLPLDRIALRGEGVADLPFDVVRTLGRLARRRGLDLSRLDVDFGFDPIGDLARRGGAALPWAEQQAGLVRTYGLIRAEGFASPMLRADARPHHEAGASEAQELAAVLATALAELRLLEAGGVPLVEAAAALSHVLVADVDLMLTVAKFRALRRLWARVEEACGLPCGPLHLHAETSWRAMTRRDPWTNILRATIGCAGALLGGADTIAVLPFTSALGLPDAAARRLARSTGLILAEESHLTKVTDPLAGSGAIETMTEALCGEAWRLFQIIEADGGFPQALLSGAWQARVAEVAAARRRDVALGNRLMTGTSQFPESEETPPSVLCPTPRSIPAATAGMACRCPALDSRRDAEPFERLRDRADAWREAHGSRPRVTLPASCSAFARELLAIGGFDVALAEAPGNASRVDAILCASGDRVAALEALWNEGLVS